MGMLAWFINTIIFNLTIHFIKQDTDCYQVSYSKNKMSRAVVSNNYYCRRLCLIGAQHAKLYQIFV